MLKSYGRSLVLIMVVIAIAALTLRLVIDQIIKLDITQNESNAAVTLKFISAALENYAKANSGTFPADLALLTQNNPPYLDKEYTVKSQTKGYNFNYQRLDPSGYSCSAIPTRCGLTGKRSYTISSGGTLVSEECSKKE